MPRRDLRSALDARRRGDWDRALELLRQRKDDIAPALLSYLRGTIWLEAGYPEVAAVFFRHASENDPANADYRAIHMYALSDADPESAKDFARQILECEDQPISIADN